MRVEYFMGLCVLVAACGTDPKVQCDGANEAAVSAWTKAVKEAEASLEVRAFRARSASASANPLGKQSRFQASTSRQRADSGIRDAQNAEQDLDRAKAVLKVHEDQDFKSFERASVFVANHNQLPDVELAKKATEAAFLACKTLIPAAEEAE